MIMPRPEIPDCVLPGEEEEAKTKGKGGEWPVELMDFKDVMDLSKAAILPHHHQFDHSIPLMENTTPPFGGLYPLSRVELEALQKYLEENLARGWIRHSESPAASPIIFVPKKDGSLRLCVDYRGLNKITVKNRYPLPLISEILDRASNAKFFSKVDLKDAYYRIRMKKGEEWKTAFRTRYGLFEYLVMPMGLTNAPATFQHYIQHALRGCLDTFAIIYLNDILIFSPNRKSHTQHLRQVMERLREASLFCNPDKCEFYKDKVKFLGYTVGKEGIFIDSLRIWMVLD